jgi:phosphopantetheine--protein transferase-like protein
MINYKIQSLKDVPGQLDWLHPSELELFGNFRFEKRKKDWLLGRWTSKNLLRESWFNRYNLQDISILPGANRAPMVFVNGQKNPCRISISHSQDKSFCSTTIDNRMVGCDLERITKRSPAFIKDYFNESEHQLATKFQDKISNEAFYMLCWSAKEALMKATRQGLSLHPRKTEVKEVELKSQSWNNLTIRNLKTDQEFHGRWKMDESMVYVIVAEIGQGLDLKAL